MKILGSIIGSRGFASVDEILLTVSRYAEDTQDKGAENAKALLIFITSRQQTWLVATRRKLYCVLDDLRDEEPRVWWDYSVEYSLDQKKFFLSDNEGKPVSVEFREQPGETSILRINSQDWQYSNKLFTPVSIQESLGRLIAEAQGSPALPMASDLSAH